MDKLHLKLPKEVKYILRTLQKAGHKAYAVGGCVRDLLLGKTPSDFDITTSAKPEENKALFCKTFDTGIKHGTITVRRNHKSFEVTTFRIDGDYKDNRHPDNVTFTSSLKEDLSRRDFTINAFAYNEEVGLVDAFNGLGDLKNKCIRCVGDPLLRFNEDALRILRAIRFSAQLGFEIEENTSLAMGKLSYLIQNVSNERINIELSKTLLSDRPEMLIEASKLGITKYFLPEFDALLNIVNGEVSLGEEAINIIKDSPKDIIIRLTILLEHVDKAVNQIKDYKIENILDCENNLSNREKVVRSILRRLRYSNYVIKTVSFLANNMEQEASPEPKEVRWLIKRISPKLFPYYLEIKKVQNIYLQSNSESSSSFDYEKLKHLYEESMKNKDCYYLKDLKVNGKDLIKLGFRGKQVGKILSNMLKAVIDEPSLNKKDYLLGHINEFSSNDIKGDEIWLKISHLF